MNFPTTSLCRGASVISAFLMGFLLLASNAEAESPEVVNANPVSTALSIGSSHGLKYEVVQEKAIFEGDILLGRVNSNGHLIGGLTERGVGLSNMFSRWPNGIIPYAFDNNTQIQSDNIARAIAHWTVHTTVSFVERDSDNADQHPNYIRFIDTNSCASHVGMVGNGEQPVYVSDSCTTGSIIHEIGHALGLFHEHTRPDRDNFVQIDWSLITSGKEINFEILDTGIENYGPYDYGSIMHYGESFFSSTGEPVITVPDGIEIGQRIALSDDDINAVNLMYATDLAVGEPVTNDTGEGIEIDLSLYNYGELGAHELQLLLRVGEDSLWKGMSSDSGWDCLTFDQELKCVRALFAGQSESSFTVLVDPVSANIDDLSISLSARTMDTDPQNNGFNDQNIEWQSLTPAENPDSGTIEQDRSGSDSLTSNSSIEPPVVAAAQNVSDTNAQASSAGMTGSALLLLLASYGWQTQRQRSRTNKSNC